jgi:hypothetical protein
MIVSVHLAWQQRGLRWRDFLASGLPEPGGVLPAGPGVPAHDQGFLTTWPAFMTNTTFLSVVTSFAGLPRTATTSA